MSTEHNCCKQETYGETKSFRCNTYKKHRGPSWHRLLCVLCIAAFRSPFSLGLQLKTYNLQPRAPRAPLATLFHPWHANASANTSSPTFTGAKKSRGPFAFRRFPCRHSLATIEISKPRFLGATSTAGSKLVRGMVK